MSNNLKSTRKEMPKVVIIGGGVGGLTLAMELTRKDMNLDITVFKKEEYGGYSPCGIPFVLEGKVSRMEDIILNPPEFYLGKGIELRTRTTVKEIDLEGRMITLEGGEKLEYDFLAIATGRKPFFPPIEGIDLEGVLTLSSYDDGIRMKGAMGDAKNAVIIGGGIIGLESAVAFSENGINTKVVEMLPSLLPQMLDPDMASLVQISLEERGIDVHTSKKVTSIKGDKTVESVVIDDGEIETDLVLIATGVRPNVDLAKNSGITIGKSGGIVINPRMNVQKEGGVLEDVYAFGDCVEIINKIVKTSLVSALASSSEIQARTIAENICGGEANIESYLSPTISVIGNLQVGSVGPTSHTLEKNNIKATVGKATGLTRSRYYPDNKKIHIKLLSHDRQLIGAQIISEEDVKERINAITIAIQNKMTIDDLLYTERCFTPPLSLLTDPFIRALDSFKKGDT